MTGANLINQLTETIWLVPNRIIFHGDCRPELVTAEKGAIYDPRLRGMIREGYANTGRKVHYIFNGKNKRTSMNLRTTQRAVAYIWEPGLGWNLYANMPNPAYRMMAQVIFRVIHNQTQIFDSVEAALLFLQAQDDDFSNLLAIYHEVIQKTYYDEAC